MRPQHAVTVKRKTPWSVGLPVEVYIFACCHRGWGAGSSVQDCACQAQQEQKRCSLIINISC